jgi:hypothetical protein
MCGTTVIESGLRLPLTQIKHAQTGRVGHYGCVADVSAVEFANVLIAWKAVARPALVRTAKKYHAIITYNELAEEVQSRTGIRTRSLMMNWIGQVLGRVFV